MCEPGLLHNMGGELLETKLRNPVSHVKYEDGMFEEFQLSALVIFDWCSADLLADTMQAGTFKRIGVLMILDVSSLASRERLLKVNLTLRMMWACTAIVIKPWTSRTKIDQRDDCTVPTETIPDIAEEINMAASKMEKLLRSPNKFLVIQASGGDV